ncbi:aminopeptidase P family protein [Qiania dongpingensis]|uniref:Aminopeptidase P family protein n=1 Tax=Qiania dongpingensis TaxID=2763669 RepID=A0A7G9G2S3_9FIRM|nr:aminopeptidase P family protein [Qiania dongpingensis]QNM05105.1 aminopeptidase P family protein [Qiania dongpingensis]
MAKQELELLRELMKKKGVDICLIPTADSHESEYPGAHFAARRYLSGFTGSAGTLAISADWAGLWTDARYFLQAEAQLKGSGITLYRMGEEGVPALEEEISARLPHGGTLAYDGTVVNRRLGIGMRRSAEQKSGRILLEDLPGEIWADRPPLSSEPVFELDIRYAGQTRTDKIRRIREQMEAAGAEAHILTTLDDIAWLLNLRGSDVPCNPVFMSYCVLTLSSVYLFIQETAVSPELRAKLERDGVELREYDTFYKAIPAVCGGRTVMLDSRKVNEQVYGALKPEQSIVDCPNPSELLKAVKNKTEADNLREAHRKDGIAVTKFLYWLKKQIGREEITELSAAEYLESCRREQDHYLEPSFTTIAAYGPNAAVVHYSATKESCAVLRPEGFFLVDSGGQYLEGTTDITRTVVLGNITEEQKKHFTAVLKGMLALGGARFLQGCRGINLDYLAREPLWAMGLDYKHGTGHGVGYLLNVHEAPNGFRWKMVPERVDSAVLKPGMVTSDEPGVYLAGKYGIRTENLLLCTEAEKTEYGQFLEFEFLTMVPIDLDGIDREEMRPEDIDRLNRYHRQVYETLSPYFKGEELAWLREATRQLV